MSFGFGLFVGKTKRTIMPQTRIEETIRTHLTNIELGFRVSPNKLASDRSSSVHNFSMGKSRDKPGTRVEADLKGKSQKDDSDTTKIKKRKRESKKYKTVEDSSRHSHNVEADLKDERMHPESSSVQGQMSKYSKKEKRKLKHSDDDEVAHVQKGKFEKKVEKFEAARTVIKTTKRLKKCNSESKVELENQFLVKKKSKKVESSGSSEEEEKTNANLKKQKKDVIERLLLKAGRMTTRICDLPPKLVGEKILTKIPITSLGQVRSTCKLWKALSRDWILGKSAARQQFLGFMTMDSKVCSVRFDLCKDEVLDLSIKQVALLDQVKISAVYHCDGLLLCIAKDHSRLVVWNPYLGQTRWIEPRTNFHRLDMYALGYDKNNRNHKILRYLDYYGINHVFGYEIYDFSSNSWRVLDVTPDWEIDFYQRGASLKGNTYFFAHESTWNTETDDNGIIREYENFLLCFDFTTERFGPRLPLPFHSYIEETVTLSCVGEEKLAVLYQRWEEIEILEIWVTTKIEPNSVSWSKFLKVDMRPLTGFQFNFLYGSFFIDEEQKVAVVFDVDRNKPTETSRYHTAFIIGDDGYFKAVSLGVAPNVWKPRPNFTHIPYVTIPPLVCSSSYSPSLVQINPPL